MKKIYLSALSIGTALFMSSCYYDNFKELRPQGAIPTPCDSLGVISFSAQIVPIMSANCTQNCHKPSAPPGNGNRDLTDSAMVRDAALSVIDPGDIGGYLYGTMSWDPKYTGGGSNNMPKNGSKVSDCDLAKIRKWAIAGAPTNN